MQRECRCVDNRGQPTDPGENKQERNTQPGVPSKAKGYILIRRCKVEFPVERIDIQDQYRRNQRTHDADDDEGYVLTISKAGQPHKSHGTGYRGVHAHGDGKPGKFASAEEIIAHRCLASREKNAYADDQRNVKRENRVVESSENHLFH